MLPNPTPYRVQDPTHQYSPVQLQLQTHTPAPYNPHYQPLTPQYGPRERPLLHLAQRRTHSFAAPSQHSQHASQQNQETLLRRKTPAGTLAAAYDASPYNAPTRPTKHILLPIPTNNNNIVHQVPASPIWAKDLNQSPIQFNPVSYGGGSSIGSGQDGHTPQSQQQGRFTWGPSPLGSALRSNSVDLSMQRLQLMSPAHATPPANPLSNPAVMNNQQQLNRMMAGGSIQGFQQYPAMQQAMQQTIQQQIQPLQQLAQQQMHTAQSLSYLEPSRHSTWPTAQYIPGMPLDPSNHGYQGIYSPTPQNNMFSFKNNEHISVTPTWDSQQVHGMADAMYSGVGGVSTAPYSYIPQITDNDIYNNMALMQNMAPTNPFFKELSSKENLFRWARDVYSKLLEHQQRTSQAQKQASTMATAGARNGGSSISPTNNYGVNGRPPFMHANSFPAANGMNMNGYSQSPTDMARVALQLLEAACKQMDWKWVDGMLIAGCLAYGLNDLKAAETWYSSILRERPNHVEATSNLASVYFCQDRHKDAEENWKRAVREKPSFLEAVEHLVSLLCGQQRMKEAVEWISHVQEKLRIRRESSTPSVQSVGTSSVESSPTQSDATASEAGNEYFHSDGEQSEKLRLGPQRRSDQSQYSTQLDYSIAATENARLLQLIHAKANMLYSLGDTNSAAMAFEEAVLIATGRDRNGIRGLINRILDAVSALPSGISFGGTGEKAPVLLIPEVALKTAHMVFPHSGELPGLREVSPQAKRTAKSTTSNSLLSLAKIFQDGMSSGSGSEKAPSGVRDILALYYLSLSLHPSPSTANNVGILLATIQQVSCRGEIPNLPTVSGVAPGSGIAHALGYYYYGLSLDQKHAHLYTNLGSLLKDLDQLQLAIKMYEQAVSFDSNFDIALANLANAVKDQGRVDEAIGYYRRAVAANPDFAEAVCGLANAQNSVCEWDGRGGVVRKDLKIDAWHVDDGGVLYPAVDSRSKGWMKRVVDIVEKQLGDGEKWGMGVIKDDVLQHILYSIATLNPKLVREAESSMQKWKGKANEGAKLLRLVERITRALTWKWYHDKYTLKRNPNSSHYKRPQLPPTLSTPTAPTVLPFHTFTCPLTAKQIRMISQRNGLKISCSTLRSSWLPATVYPPPPPPNPVLNVGYISSDFNNHPLAHLMQSVFGMHDQTKVKAVCYATTASDGTSHRLQIEREAPVFHDASTWTHDRIIQQIIEDKIHILVNLNGFTRGARNEIFAARPAPIQMSFMGFAGTLGAEWCDYLLADTTAVPPDTVRPYRKSVKFDSVEEETEENSEGDWVYTENIAFTKHSFFCCDHRQSAPDAHNNNTSISWSEELHRRWEQRRELFPDIAPQTIILGNFNQLYKIEPTTFRSWLRILQAVPNAILWLLRFPELGERNLLRTAEKWAGKEVASRVRFTAVAAKDKHISRAKVCDLFLDTPECNAHTTAADVLWSGTPLLTLPRHKYKMCSRVAASLLRSAVPQTPDGRAMADSLIAKDDAEYEARAIQLCRDLRYEEANTGVGHGELMEIRKALFTGRWSNELFDTRRWVRDLEKVYDEAWSRWERGEAGDIFLDEEERKRWGGEEAERRKK